jgi:VanZ family protein
MSRMPAAVVASLHHPAWRPRWAALLAALMVAVCWLAFTPSTPALTFDNQDKLEHLLAFTVLAGTALLALPGGLRGARLAGSSMLLFGAFIEAVQTQVPGRSGDWADLAADAAGIAIGLALVAALRHRLPPRG